MSRRQRTDIDGAIHHVMNRGVDRQIVFFSDADRVEFGRRLAAIHEEHRVATLAYCLMPNHYHVLLHAPTGGLSAAMQHLSSVYTRHTNDRIGRDGPLFRGRFHAIHVATDGYLDWVARYIHRNPLSLAGAQSAADYRWSSYRSYLGHRRRASFLDTQLVLGRFDDDVARFARWTDGDQAGFDIGRVGDIDIRQLIQCAIACEDLAFGADEVSTRMLERTVIMLVADRFPMAPVSAQLTRRLDFPSPTARRMALHRARKRRAHDPALDRVVSQVVDAIHPDRRTA